MINLSFPTKKLKTYIRKVNMKVKDTNYKQEDLIVYGVTNKDGIKVTGNQASEDLSSYYVLRENQFAYNPYRINVGSLGLAPTGSLGVVSPAYVVFEATSELSNEFLYHYLKSTLGINLIKWYGDRGGVRSALRYTDLEEIDIPDLSLGRQLSLLKKIKELNVYLDDLYSNLDTQIDLNFKFRQSILLEAVQGKLVQQDLNDEPASVLLRKVKAEKEQLLKEKKIKKEKPLPEITESEIPYNLPNGWEWVRFQDITSVITCGLASTPDYVENGKIFLSAKNIKPYKFLPEDHRFISMKDYEKLTQNAKPEKNDILLTRVGAGIGEAAIIDKELDFAIYVSLTLIKPIYNFIEPKYLLHWINSPEGVGKALESTFGIGMSQGNLNVNQVRKFMIPLPPFKEQIRIVEKVDQLMSLSDQLENTLEESKKESELLMQSVLQKAFIESEEIN